MKPKRKIISIKCPNCKKRNMIIKNNLIKYRSITEKEWYCLGCPAWIWADSWFNHFKHFEDLVKREGDELKTPYYDTLKPQKQ